MRLIIFNIVNMSKKHSNDLMKTLKGRNETQISFHFFFHFCCIASEFVCVSLRFSLLTVISDCDASTGFFLSNTVVPFVDDDDNVTMKCTKLDDVENEACARALFFFLVCSFLASFLDFW